MVVVTPLVSFPSQSIESAGLVKSPFFYHPFGVIFIPFGEIHWFIEDFPWLQSGFV